MPIIFWATEDNNWDVRKSAIQAIARGGKNHPDTLPLLKLIVTEDNDYYVRITAVQEIAKGWKNEPDILPLLKLIVTEDDDCRVRDAAIETIASGWHDEAGIFQLLYHTAIKDPFNEPLQGNSLFKFNPRQTALEAIIQYYSHLPQTLPLLRDRAENDSDEKVRELASETLKKWGKS